MQHCSSFPNLPDHRLRLLRNSCFFCLIFLIFWLPYGVFQFPLDLPKEVVPEMLSAYLLLYFKFCKNITYCLIALNPVILFVLSYDLFKHVPSYGDILHRRRQWRAWLMAMCGRDATQDNDKKIVVEQNCDESTDTVICRLDRESHF